MGDKEKADVKSKEPKLMMQKLREHLTNLDRIEAMLVRDPWNDELHKLKTDLHELIRLISWRMLALKNEKKEKKKSKSDAGKSSRAAPPPPVTVPNVNDMLIPIVVKDLENVAATTVELVKLCRLPPIPDLPDCFYQDRKTFEAQYPRVPCSASIENGPGSKNKTTKEDDTAVPSSLITIKKGLTRNQRRCRQRKIMGLKVALVLSASQNNEVDIENDAGCQKMNGNDSAAHDDSEGNNVEAEGSSGCQKTGVEDVTEEVAATANSNGEGEKIEEDLDCLETEKKDKDIIEDDNTITGSTLSNGDNNEDEQIEAGDDDRKVVNLPKTLNKTVGGLTLAKRGSNKTRKRNRRKQKRIALELLENKTLLHNSSNSNNNSGENNIEGHADFQKTEDDKMVGGAMSTLSPNGNTGQSIDGFQKTDDAEVEEDGIVSATTPSSNVNCEGQNTQNGLELKKMEDEDIKEEAIVTATTTSDNGNDEDHKMEDGSGCLEKEVEDMVEDVTAVPGPSSSSNGEKLKIEGDSGIEKKEDEETEMTAEDNAVTTTTGSSNSNKSISVCANPGKRCNGRFSNRPNLLKKIQVHACSQAVYKRIFRIYISRRNQNICNFFKNHTLVMIHGEISVHSTLTKFCRQCKKKCECE